MEHFKNHKVSLPHNVSLWAQKLTHNDTFCQCLAPEIVKMGQHNFWAQKLTLWVNYWAQKLTHFVSFWSQKLFSRILANRKRKNNLNINSHIYRQNRLTIVYLNSQIRNTERGNMIIRTSSQLERNSSVFWETYFPTNARLLQQYNTTPGLSTSSLCSGLVYLLYPSGQQQ